MTGFEPFGGDAENASQAAVARLVADWADAGVELLTATLPVTFAGAPDRLAALVAEHRPDAALAVGEAGGRAEVTPERYGRNRLDARIPDNAGARPRDQRVDDGPALRPATLDVDDMAARLRAGGLPARVSEDAGAFVCNRVAVAVAALDVPAAFVHVPAFRSTGVAGVGAETDSRAVVRPGGLDLDDLARALGICVRSAVDSVRRGCGSA
ncbi:pyroglutamyl-peptidase I [Desertihabitans aurantiacus]|uniref:pyroglutamyl-peptidase I n=1 Tax=Desertihabitans aurantiacus TaxID=2282477 RepID=UPI001E3429F0|nr:pyroglutamyl-peptidase I [Desertihabitans aurantiacus]